MADQLLEAGHVQAPPLHAGRDDDRRRLDPVAARELEHLVARRRALPADHAAQDEQLRAEALRLPAADPREPGPAHRWPCWVQAEVVLDP